jgi:hypothetical protein
VGWEKKELVQMSTHPNAILAVALTPDETTRKTLRAILAEAGIDDDDQIKIGDAEYHLIVMESDYDDSMQVSAKEGDIVALDMVTYGYGETISWAKLEAQKTDLEQWAKGVCERHKCSYEIFVTANYW